MALSIQGTGEGFFATSRNRRSDILRQNPVFSPPTNDFSKSNIADKSSVFREPEADDRDRQFNRSPDRFRSEKQTLFNAIPTQVKLGESLERLEEFAEAPPRGGNTLEVSGNNITVSNEQGESISFEANDNGRLIRTKDDDLILRNDSRDTEITIQPGSSVSTEGSGNLTVFGEDNPVTVDAGQNFQTTDTASGVSIRNPNTASTLELANDGNTISVESQRSDANDVLTISGDGGAFIKFNQGESGTLSRNDDGTFTITNRSTGESSTFRSRGDLTFGGQATGTLRSESTGGSLTLNRNKTFSLTTTEDDALTVRDETSAKSTSIASERESPRPSRPLRFQFFENLGIRSNQILTDRLLVQPLKQQTEEPTGNRTNSGRSGQRQTNSSSNRPNQENGRSGTNSPFERSDPSKFSRLSNDNPGGTRFGTARTGPEPNFTNRSLRSTFNASENSTSFQSSTFNRRA